MGRKLATSDGRGAERKIANDKKGMKQLRYIFFLILLKFLKIKTADTIWMKLSFDVCIGFFTLFV